MALESAQDYADYPRYLLRLCELERFERESAFLTPRAISMGGLIQDLFNYAYQNIFTAYFFGPEHLSPHLSYSESSGVKLLCSGP